MRRDERGFTLLELWIIIAIIGILAVIAITQFSGYRTRAFDATVMADLRNAMTAQEAYFVDWSTYAKDKTALISGSYNLYESEGVVLVIDVGATDDVSYRMIASHENSTNVYVIDGPGGSVELNNAHGFLSHGL